MDEVTTETGAEAVPAPVAKPARKKSGAKKKTAKKKTAKKKKK